MSQVQRHADGRPVAFRHFELTIGVFLLEGAPLPDAFVEWLELATGADLSGGIAVPTTLERIVETRLPVAVDVFAKRQEGRGKF